MSDLPFAHGSDTSEAAARSMKPVAGEQEALVHAYILGRGPHGATCDEVESFLGLKHQSASARIHALVKKGTIRKTEYRRATASGRLAAVYVTNTPNNAGVK